MAGCSRCAEKIHPRCGPFDVVHSERGAPVGARESSVGVPGRSARAGFVACFRAMLITGQPSVLISHRRAVTDAGIPS